MRRCNTRSLAENLDSPEASVFLTSIIDGIVGVATYYMHHHSLVMPFVVLSKRTTGPSETETSRLALLTSTPATVAMFSPLDVMMPAVLHTCTCGP